LSLRLFRVFALSRFRDPFTVARATVPVPRAQAATTADLFPNESTPLARQGEQMETVA